MEGKEIKMRKGIADYEWIRSSRKTIAIQVKINGCVVVRSPYGTARSQIERFLAQKNGFRRSRKKFAGWRKSSV